MLKNYFLKTVKSLNNFLRREKGLDIFDKL